MGECLEYNLEESKARTASGTSRVFFEVAPFNQAVFILKVTALGGSPDSATLDVEVENYDPTTGATDTILAFTQVTELTSLPSTEWKYTLTAGKLLGNAIRVKYTLAFIGGSNPSWTFQVSTQLKERNSEVGSG